MRCGTYEIGAQCIKRRHIVRGILCSRKGENILMIKPKALKSGATLGLVGPSGAIRTDDGLERSVALLEAMGYNVKVGVSAGARYGYLSGNDELRARDLNDMFKDDTVDAIICTKGGYGTPRILDLLDYEAARRHPKLFIGYSDITALLIAYGQYADMVTFHGPMPASCMINDFDEYSKEHFMRAISDAAPLGEICNCDGQTRTCLNGGRTCAPMVGGNLSLVTELLGTPYELDCRGRILLLEDVGERTYRLDGMLNHLRLAGKFEECAGVVFGDFTRCNSEPEGFGFTLDEVIRDIVLPCGKPVMGGLCAGHGKHKLTLPMGIAYELDADNCRLTALESALV